MKTLDLRPFCNEVDVDTAVALMESEVIGDFTNLGVILVTDISSYDHATGHLQHAKRRWFQKIASFIPESLLDGYGKWPIVLSAVGLPSFHRLALVPLEIERHMAIEASRDQPNFLDFSYMQSFDVRHHQLSLANYSNLRVLKIRGVSLDDTQLRFILCKGEFQLWSLDVRDNNLTDKAIEVLLKWGIMPDIPRRYTRVDDDIRYEAPPLYDNQHLMIDLDEFPQVRHDDVERFSAELYDGRPSSNMNAFSANSNGLNVSTGITNLYLSGNKFTPDAIKTLLRRGTTLQVLDIGSVRDELIELALKQTYVRCLSLHAISEYLTAKHAPPIEILRVHHWIVTQTPTILTSGNQHLTIKSLIPQTYYDKGIPTLLPSMNYRIRNLTLTAIPRQCDRQFLGKLIMFLNGARDQEQELAALKNHRRAPPKLSGLRVLRLEFLPEVVRQPSVSVSGDSDADTFHKASEGDFSFFEKEVRESKGEGKGKGKERGPAPAEEPESLDLVEALKEYRGKEPKWGGRLELVFPSEEECQCLKRK